MRIALSSACGGNNIRLPRPPPRLSVILSSPRASLGQFQTGAEDGFNPKHLGPTLARRIDLCQGAGRSPSVRSADHGRDEIYMDYRGIFEDAVDTLRAEKRYRVFADIERVAGKFPAAIFRDQSDNQREITIWCSNDYLGMGQHPKVIAAMQETAASSAWAPAARAIFPAPTGRWSSSSVRSPTCTARKRRWCSPRAS